MYNNKYLKVALVTPKVTLGKPLENAKEIIKVASENQDSGMLVYPELSITGYSIGDWVYNAQLLEETRQAVNYVKDASNEQILVIGAPVDVLGAIYDCGIVIQNKKLLGIVPKINLPNTSEFYEERFFTSGKAWKDKISEVEYAGENVPFGHILFKEDTDKFNFGVEICGDLWGENNPHHLLYSEGADFVVNLSGSSYNLGKGSLRTSLVQSASHRHRGGYLYVSNGPSDSTSDLTFSGHQIACIAGEIVLSQETNSLETVVNKVDVDIEYIRFAKYSDSYAKKDHFPTENFVKFHINEDNEYKLSKKVDYLPFVPKSDEQFESLINIATLALKHRLDHIGINKVVIGISGGLDSTLALMFSYECFKRYNIDLKNIIAITMPGFGTGSKSKNIANKLMEKLCVSAHEISIKKEAILHLKTIGHDLENKDVTYENVQARLRTMYLMNVANKNGAIVLGTGDMSEIALGWSTFNGDQMSMYNLNANLPKTVVKELVRYFSRKYPLVKSELLKVYGAVISPELTGSDQATEDNIGKYLINDFIMYHMFLKGASKSRIVYLLLNTFEITETEASLYYDRFIKRFKQNQYKRLASPECVKYYSFSFGARGDYRFPGDMK